MLEIKHEKWSTRTINCLLSKSGLSTPKEDNHHYGDDDLHGSRKRHTGRKNPL